MLLKSPLFGFRIFSLRLSSSTVGSSANIVSQIESLNKCQLEFNCGVGGTESMLFTNDIYRMYKCLAARLNWNWVPIQIDNVPQGGMRSAIVGLEGEECFARLRFEAGVHRVQRIPITDKNRVHTSTATVSVLPEPENPQMLISSKDVKVETMRASGPGGQNVNKRSTAVRITHLETGISLKVMDERHQYENINIAYRRLASILLQNKIDVAVSNFKKARKLQVGSLARASKIRTYNFKDNRVTDHRLKFSTNQLEDFLNGGESLEEMLNQLQELYIMETLEEEQELAKKNNVLIN